MKLTIQTETNPLLIFDNIKNLKTLLKPIEIVDIEKLFNILNDRASKLTAIISKGFDDMNNNDFKLNCTIKTNCCFAICSSFWGGCNYGYLILDKDGSDVSFDTELKNEILSETIFPSKIQMKEIIFEQKIRNYSSIFSFKNEYL